MNIVEYRGQRTEYRRQRKFVICFLLSVFCYLSSVYSLSLNDAYKDYLYGDYQRAITKAQKLKEDSEVLYFLGLAHIKTGNYSKARLYLRKLLRKFPQSRFYQQGLVKLADTYFLERNFAEAKFLYKKIAESYPPSNYSPLVILRLAQIASKEGNWQNKRKYLEVLKEKYPESSEMRFAKILSSFGDFFTIQVGAFSEKKNALSLKVELEDRGYSTYLLTEKGKEFTLHKVRIGRFKKRENAERMYLRLLKQGYPAHIYP